MPYAPEHDEVPNPLRQGLRVDSTPEPCAIVAFGASGDLAHRKLLPALYNLALGAHLPAAFGIVGVSKSPFTHEQYAHDMREAVGKFSRNKPVDEEVWRDFGAGLRYVPGAFDDDDTFRRLAATLEELDRTRATRANRLFYFATPPSTFPTLLVKIKVLRSLCPIDTPEQVARRVVVGQYDAGQIAGTDVAGYQEEKDVAKGSRTPTFVAIKLDINNWRWEGVPFYVRSGKRLPKRAT